MTRTDTRIGWLCLLLSACLSVALLAHGSSESGAYFTDERSGIIMGTYAPSPPTIPFAVELGTSKALHWGAGEDGPASGEPIAQLDSSGGMYLDFGEAPKGHGDARPDVFRLASLADDTRDVSFRVTGAMSEFISIVRLGDGAGEALPARETVRVYVKIRVPDDAQPGMYRGALALSVEGWAAAVSMPLSIEVVEDGPKKQQMAEIVVGGGESSDATASVETTATASPVETSQPDSSGSERPEVGAGNATDESAGQSTHESASTHEPTSTPEATAALCPQLSGARAARDTLEQW